MLERPVVGPPGERWTYNGGASALLGRLIARGTGRTLDDFARSVLFGPLGIDAFEWIPNPNGDPIAASGLRLTARDLARIGVMVLNGGRFGGRQIVPEGWLTACFEPRIDMPDGRKYGHQWYVGGVLSDDGAGGYRRHVMHYAAGNGGQRLFLLPDTDIVVAVTAGNYDAAEQWRPPIVVLRDVLLPALLPGTA